MSKIVNIPELRFKEFSGEWDTKPYGEIYKFYATNSLSREKLNYQSGEVYNIHYGDIHKKFSTMFNLENENVPFINSDVDLSKIKEENYCQIGDLIVADASEDYIDIGKTIEIISLNGKKTLSGLHTFLARPNKEYVALGFVGYMLQNYTVRKQIMKIAQGTKVLSLSTGRLSNIILNLPSKLEQQKIASFLTTIDTKIEQLSKKVELQEQYKKGVMQKIFNQEIRFKNDDGSGFDEWEWKNGNLIFQAISNKNHNSDLPILAISQEYGAIPRDMIDYKISVTNNSITSYKVVEVGDFIISLRSFQGGIEYSNYKGICSPAYIILRAIIDIDNRFFKFYFKTHRYIQQLNSKLEGIRDGKMISYKYFSEIKLPLPQKEEQTKIANFFSTLDKQIGSTKKQLAKTKEFKKGLLQRMFV